MKTVKLGFVDFAGHWGPWPSPIEFIRNTLKDDYDIQVTNSDFVGNCFDSGVAPEFVICAIGRTGHTKYTCPKIFWPEEPWVPLDLETYQYALTFRIIDDPRHHRLPIYPLFADVASLMQPRPFNEPKEFCAVLLGHPYPNEMTPREEFFRRLCGYKKVHSAGHYLNNVGFAKTMQEKTDFVKNYKFVLAFESQSIPGFTTEKCFQPLVANTVPIYWGNPFIGRDFNTKRFINGMDYENLDKLFDRIVEVDSNPDLYRAMLQEPVFPGNVPANEVTKEGLVKFFRGIFG